VPLQRVPLLPSHAGYVERVDVGRLLVEPLLQLASVDELHVADRPRAWVPHGVSSSWGYGWRLLAPSAAEAVGRRSDLLNGAQPVVLCKFWVLSQDFSLKRVALLAVIDATSSGSADRLYSN